MLAWNVDPASPPPAQVRGRQVRSPTDVGCCSRFSGLDQFRSCRASVHLSTCPPVHLLSCPPAPRVLSSGSICSVCSARRALRDVLLERD